ncbi:hypothetical protein ACJX0J_035304, partial [Zea mays]
FLKQKLARAFNILGTTKGQILQKTQRLDENRRAPCWGFYLHLISCHLNNFNDIEETFHPCSILFYLLNLGGWVLIFLLYQTSKSCIFLLIIGGVIVIVILQIVFVNVYVIGKTIIIYIILKIINIYMT